MCWNAGELTIPRFFRQLILLPKTENEESKLRCHCWTSTIIAQLQTKGTVCTATIEFSLEHEVFHTQFSVQACRGARYLFLSSERNVRTWKRRRKQVATYRSRTYVCGKCFGKCATKLLAWFDNERRWLPNDLKCDDVVGSETTGARIASHAR